MTGLSQERNHDAGNDTGGGEMNIEDPEIAALREKFVHFREECIWLTNCYNLYKTLYEGGPETDALLHRVAPALFLDLNRIVIDHILLQICKITDPATSRDRQNLTLANLNKDLQTVDLFSPEIELVSADLNAYREVIKPARDKLISHLDWKTVRDGQSLAAHAADEVNFFFAGLFRYTDLVGEACGIGPLDYRVSACTGDAIDLLRFLRQAAPTPSSTANRG